jgi:hypothetical protein
VRERVTAAGDAEMKTYTKAEVKKEFRLYFADLQASLRSEGGKADRQTEWQFFVRNNVDEGHLPEDALNWKL